LKNSEDMNAEGTLDRASIGDALSVQRIDAPQAAPEWARWLEEIGFIVGEQVMLMARALPGGDPLVVRIGQSTFALRRAEAACIRVSAVAALSATERAVPEGSR
jgi:ferrous iron transport protein A